MSVKFIIELVIYISSLMKFIDSQFKGEKFIILTI